MLLMAGVFKELKKGEYAPYDILLQRYTSRPDISNLQRLDIPKEQADAEPTYENVLSALEAVDFPINTSRINTQKLDMVDAQTSMCMGVVYSWRTSNTGFAGGAAGDNGVIASCHTQGRPHLSRLLSRYCEANMPGFSFTSIQVNKNYESALHCDKKNLGPSAIVGLGNYTEGWLWGEEFGSVDVKNNWFEFDGNMPHCTLPFGGTRYTLIYFINQGYEKVNPGDRNLIADTCNFPWPKDGLKKKRDYGTTPARLHIGQKALDRWKQCQKDGTKYEYIFEDACSCAASRAGAIENKQKKKTRERLRKIAAGIEVKSEAEEAEEERRKKAEKAAKKALKQHLKRKDLAGVDPDAIGPMPPPVAPLMGPIPPPVAPAMGPTPPSGPPPKKPKTEGQGQGDAAGGRGRARGRPRGRPRGSGRGRGRGRGRGHTLEQQPAADMQTQGSAAPSAGTSAGVAASSGASTADGTQAPASATTAAGTSGVATSAAAAADGTPKAEARTSTEASATPGAATDDMMHTHGSPDSGSGRPKRERNKRVIHEPPGKFATGDLVVMCFCACRCKGWVCVQFNTAAVSSGPDLSHPSGNVCEQDLTARHSWLQRNPKRRVHSRRLPRQQKSSSGVWSAQFQSLCSSAA